MRGMRLGFVFVRMRLRDRFVRTHDLCMHDLGIRMGDRFIRGRFFRDRVLRMRDLCAERECAEQERAHHRVRHRDPAKPHGSTTSPTIGAWSESGIVGSPVVASWCTTPESGRHVWLVKR